MRGGTVGILLFARFMLCTYILYCVTSYINIVLATRRMVIAFLLPPSHTVPYGTHQYVMLSFILSNSFVQCTLHSLTQYILEIQQKIPDL